MKSICAAGFVLVSICAIFASGELTRYSFFILIGAVMGAEGDIFLGISTRGKWFIMGLLSFLSGHILYIIAFLNGSAAYGNKTLFNIYEVAAIAALLLLFTFIGVKVKAKAGKMLPAILLYAAAISAMLVKAVSLSVIVAGNNRIPASICLISGAALFVLSDSLLSLRLFTKIRLKKMPWLCLASYFSAQVLIALSIYFLA
jgi:uncharacterized membrane protein YhhN